MDTQTPELKMLSLTDRGAQPVSRENVAKIMSTFGVQNEKLNEAVEKAALKKYGVLDPESGENRFPGIGILDPETGEYRFPDNFTPEMLAGSGTQVFVRRNKEAVESKQVEKVAIRKADLKFTEPGTGRCFLLSDEKAVLPINPAILDQFFQECDQEIERVLLSWPAPDFPIFTGNLPLLLTGTPMDKVTNYYSVLKIYMLVMKILMADKRTAATRVGQTFQHVLALLEEKKLTMEELQAFCSALRLKEEATGLFNPSDLLVRHQTYQLHPEYLAYARSMTVRIEALVYSPKELDGKVFHDDVLDGLDHARQHLLDTHGLSATSADPGLDRSIAFAFDLLKAYEITIMRLMSTAVGIPTFAWGEFATQHLIPPPESIPERVWTYMHSSKEYMARARSSDPNLVLEHQRIQPPYMSGAEYQIFLNFLNSQLLYDGSGSGGVSDDGASSSSGGAAAAAEAAETPMPDLSED